MTKEIWKRAGMTFVEAFLGALVPQIALLLNDVAQFNSWTVVVPIIAGAIGAGISAGWNVIITNKSKQNDT